jgi:segregation and condensation protein A
MDNPVFKLEGVVHERSAEALQDFEGPLDLILFLLSKNKIEIQDIPIALILDQYLAYLEQRKQLDLEVASEFITMAAHLMYIKTRMLLSLEDEQAQSEMDELIASLKERQQKDTYLRIKTLTETLGPMGEFGRSIMTRQPEPMQRGKIYEYSHEKADLVLAMQTIMERGEKLAAPPSTSISILRLPAACRLRCRPLQRNNSHRRRPAPYPTAGWRPPRQCLRPDAGPP